MATQQAEAPRAGLAERYAAVRGLTSALAAPLSDADATIQPMPDASPAKWHLAHTSWFFETFVLRDQVPGYALHAPEWCYLFNSYYEGEGRRIARDRRGMLSRPSLQQILDYRDVVDDAVLNALPHLPQAAADLVELGLNHEQQHQELLLMDLLAAMAENPLRPPVWDAAPESGTQAVEPAVFKRFDGGIVEIGHAGGGFAFDCETPRHRVFLKPFALADRPVINAEWLQFIEDGGYSDPLLWLSDGWAWVQREAVAAPLYWEQRDGAWMRFGLDGLHPVDPAEAVCHISYYEADAFARWAGARLPTEAEWEHAAALLGDPLHGEQLDRAGPVRPRLPMHPSHFGTVWQWTGSAFLPYPGFKPAPGAVGEYNGKFMSGQMVLRGGSCATPRGHMRASYRNFFYPHQRWMFAGVRLARDA
jgi:ergothioneine biosynthesis protein EgtB